MSNQFTSPQIYMFGRIVSGNGFSADELFVKYKFIYGEDFEVKKGNVSGETYQSKAYRDEEGIAVYFDQPLYLHLKCTGISGWPKLFVEVWEVDEDEKTSLGGYGIASIPVKAGCSKFPICCWRPTESLSFNFEEAFLGNVPEYKNKFAVETTVSKFGVTSMSTGQIIVEIECLFQNFSFFGINI